MASVAEFLAISDGSGDGYGYGYGIGSGCGNAIGNGKGTGGSCDGYGGGKGTGTGGCGDGYGGGITAFCGDVVIPVDGLDTIITSVRGNIAKGYILRSDLTLAPTFIARVGDSFAHGATIREAVYDATNKHLDNMPDEARIDEFLRRCPPNESHSGHDLLAGYRMLTGACKQGCDEFIRSRSIDLDSQMTLAEFCKLTRDQYGGDIVRLLEDRL